jgi:hypothetical protein
LKWREVFEDQSKSSPLDLIRAKDDQLFSLPLGEHREAFEIWLPKDKIWERFATISHIAVLQREEREVRPDARQHGMLVSERLTSCSAAHL